MLRHPLNDAVRWELIPKTPTAGVKLPRVAKYRARLLQPVEARHVLQTIAGNRLEALYGVDLSLRPAPAWYFG